MYLQNWVMCCLKLISPCALLKRDSLLFDCLKHLQWRRLHYSHSGRAQSIQIPHFTVKTGISYSINHADKLNLSNPILGVSFLGVILAGHIRSLGRYYLSGRQTLVVLPRNLLLYIRRSLPPWDSAAPR